VPAKNPQFQAYRDPTMAGQHGEVSCTRPALIPPANRNSLRAQRSRFPDMERAVKATGFDAERPDESERRVSRARARLQCSSRRLYTASEAGQISSVRADCCHRFQLIAAQPAKGSHSRERPEFQNSIASSRFQLSRLQKPKPHAGSSMPRR
jgi:hypothetical protein